QRVGIVRGIVARTIKTHPRLGPPTLLILNDFWSRRQGLNLRPSDYKSDALPTELRRPGVFFEYSAPFCRMLRLCYNRFSYCTGESCLMAQVCEICGRGPQFGNRISHAHNVTKRRWNLNLQSVRALVNGAGRRIRVCTSCIRSNKVQKVA